MQDLVRSQTHDETMSDDNDYYINFWGGTHDHIYEEFAASLNKLYFSIIPAKTFTNNRVHDDDAGARLSLSSSQMLLTYIVWPGFTGQTINLWEIMTLLTKEFHCYSSLLISFWYIHCSSFLAQRFLVLNIKLVNKVLISPSWWMIRKNYSKFLS